MMYLFFPAVWSLLILLLLFLNEVVCFPFFWLLSEKKQPQTHYIKMLQLKPQSL